MTTATTTEERLRESEAQLAAARHTIGQLESRCAELETQNFELASLYTASAQLHGTCREAVLTAMQEIIINLIGSEQFAICDIDAPTLTILASVGVEAEQVRWTPHLLEAVNRAEPYIGSLPEVARGGTTEPLVCLPLRAQDQVIGAVVVFGLLSHKSEFEPLDHQLFDLLSALAGPALYCTRSAP
jgi:nitrate/nitrite-specific signal transduction histidine kinase